jgi:hypothetical protein
LTEISPDSSTSTQSLKEIPSDHLTYHPPQPQVQQGQYHPNPGLGDIKSHPSPYLQTDNGHGNGNGNGNGKGHASNKSSYSSLSAVSNLAPSIRKRNIYDSSTSTSNLRSVSGSSTSSFPLYHEDPTNHLKRPVGQESHVRSSRARVEEMLPDLTTPSWVPGHDPNHGFHIGSDPRSMPHSYPYLNTNPPPYESEGYHIHPHSQDSRHQGWNVQGEFQYLPHMDHFNANIHMGTGTGMGNPERTGNGEAEAGWFVMPREYNFTFAQARN